MEELVKQLQTNAQNIDGTDMIELSVAIQAVQAASAMQMVDSLDKMLADLNIIIADAGVHDTEE